MENTYMGQDGLLYCKTCGGARQRTMIVPLKGERTVGIMCDCMVAEKRRIEQQQKDNENSIRRKICFANSNMYKWTFQNSDGNNPQMEEVMRNYVKNFTTFKKDGKGLLLWGTVGTGKTYMAACIANALIDEGYKVLMTNFASLTNTIQGMFDGKQRFINSLNHYALIIIDDLGAERKSEFMQEMVFNIIDSRYRAGLPMIITTNLSIEEIKKPKDISNSRIYDRILERCHPIEISGVSKRRKKIVENWAETQMMLGIKKGD
jgi:DNA replication protein DnaC